MKINNNITGIVGIILFTLGLLKIINIYLLQKVITIISEFLIDLHFGSFSSKGYILDINLPIVLSIAVMMLGALLGIQFRKK